MDLLDLLVLSAQIFHLRMLWWLSRTSKGRSNSIISWPWSSSIRGHLSHSLLLLNLWLWLHAVSKILTGMIVSVSYTHLTLPTIYSV